MFKYCYVYVRRMKDSYDNIVSVSNKYRFRKRINPFSGRDFSKNLKYLFLFKAIFSLTD